jgi:hypothetical protein
MPGPDYLYLRPPLEYRNVSGTGKGFGAIFWPDIHACSKLLDFEPDTSLRSPILTTSQASITVSYVICDMPKSWMLCECLESLVFHLCLRKAKTPPMDVHHVSLVWPSNTMWIFHIHNTTPAFAAALNVTVACAKHVLCEPGHGSLAFQAVFQLPFTDNCG